MKNRREASLRPRDSGRRLVPATLALVLSACAIPGRTPEVPDLGQELLAAGFTRTVAVDSQRLGQYRSLPQRRLLPFDRERVTHYLYADAEGCRCVYEGDEAAYRRYRQSAGGR